MSFYRNKLRSFSIITVLVYLILLVVPVIAADDIKLSVSTGSASPGSEIVLEVSLNKAENIGAMNFTLEYDKNVFKLKNGNEDISINNKIKQAMLLTGVNGKNAGEIIFAGAGINPLNSSGPVQICTIKLTVLSDVYSGSYDINFVKVNIYDATVKKIPVALTNGRIEVKALTSPPVDIEVPIIKLIGEDSVIVTKGDTYTDAGVTITDNVDTDLEAVITYTLDGEDVDGIDTDVVGTYTIHYNVSDVAGNVATEVTRTVIVKKVPDINGDGKVDSGDILMLLRHIVGKEDLTPEQMAVADINGDNIIDVGDALLILRYILNS